MSLHLSFAAVALVFVLGELLRVCLRKTLPERWFRCLSEMISTFQMSAYVFEIGVINRYHDFYFGIFCAFVLLSLKNYEVLFKGDTANPCGVLELVYNKQRLSLDVLLHGVFQVLGALLSYPFIRTVWKTLLSNLHVRILNTEFGSSLEVSILNGFAIEAFATLLNHGLDLSTRNILGGINPVVRAGFCVGLAVSLTGTTGLWMNPALATIHAFGSGRTVLEHVAVYWAGPLMGTLLAMEVNTSLQRKDKSFKTVKRHESMVRKIKKRNGHKSATVNARKPKRQKA